jgi:integrase
MPRLTGNQVPKLRRHRTGQAVVTLNGRDCYCGVYGKAESQRRYNQLVAEWLVNGRRFPALTPTNGTTDGLTIIEVCERYLDDRRAYFAGPNGKPTRSFLRIKAVVKLLMDHYAKLSAKQFGALKLRAVRESLIKPDVTRNYVNEIVSDIRTMFKWASSLEYIPVEVYQSLCTVAALKAGKTLARESEPITPIDDLTFAATVDQMPKIIADMTMVQRYCGARPGEVVLLRPCDIDRERAVWLFRPLRHKMQHKGKDRVIPLGPKAQAIVSKYLDRSPDAYCFSPREAQAVRLADLARTRKTPLNQGNRPGTNRKRNPKRKPGVRYTSVSYARAIARACAKAFPIPKELEGNEAAKWVTDHCWQPNRIRHSAATEIRKKFGLEAASVVLGHAKADVTQIYAERDLNKAIQVAAEIG